MEASSVASSPEQSLVGASGYKFHREDKKIAKVKLKTIPLQTKREIESNGTHEWLQEKQRR